MAQAVPIQLRAASPRWRVEARWAAPLCLMAAAFLLRAPQFGNPLSGFDEQLYLLIGERMWGGAVPYIDLWDRKPPGLFALFALFSAFGNGLIVSQIAATLCAGATACIIQRLAARRAGAFAATLAGITYLIFLRPLAGGSTQTPVFYNLFLAIAALIVLRVAAQPRSSVWPGIAAMLLCGLSIQLKPTAALEGAWFGLFLLALHHRVGMPAGEIACRAAPYVLAGLAPSLLAAGFYVAIGAFGAFWFANVESIFMRQGGFNAVAIEQLLVTIIRAGPALLAGGAGLVLALRRGRADVATLLLTGWVAVAAVEFVMLGSFWPHYLLPLMAPLCVFAAHLYTRGVTGIAMFALVAGPPGVAILTRDLPTSRFEHRLADEIAAAIPAAVRTRCLFVYEGPTALYSLTRACPVTRFVFTDHLRSSRDGPALGVDPTQELGHALARRPLAVVKLQNPTWKLRIPASDRLIAEMLKRDYRLAATFADVDPDHPETRHELWLLNGQRTRR